MKDKNLPNDYNSLSLEELTIEANKMIEELENQKDLGNSIDKYQNLTIQIMDYKWIFSRPFFKSIYFFTSFIRVSICCETINSFSWNCHTLAFIEEFLSFFNICKINFHVLSESII